MPGDDAEDARWFAVDEIPWADLSKIGSAEVVGEWAWDTNPDEDIDRERVRADMMMPVQHGTRSPSKTKCPGCDAALNDDGTCSADPERSLPPLSRPRIGDPIVRKGVQRAGE